MTIRVATIEKDNAMGLILPKIPAELNGDNELSTIVDLNYKSKY